MACASGYTTARAGNTSRRPNCVRNAIFRSTTRRYWPSSRRKPCCTTICSRTWCSRCSGALPQSDPMQIKAEQLRAHLAKGRLARLYVVAGDEALLAIEAQDAIRAAARAQGYAERTVLHADARFDWSLLLQAARSGSLFSERRIIDLRLPS